MDTDLGKGPASETGLSVFIGVHPWLNYSFGKNVNATAARMQANAAK